MEVAVLLGNRPLRTNSSLTVLTSASFLGILYLMPQFLQTVRGFDPLESGLTTFPEAVGVVITLQIIARVYPRIGPRRLQLTGLVALAVIIGCMGLIGLDTPRWQIVMLMFLAGVSMGFVFMPTQTAAYPGCRRRPHHEAA